MFPKIRGPDINSKLQYSYFKDTHKLIPAFDRNPTEPTKYIDLNSLKGCQPNCEKRKTPPGVEREARKNNPSCSPTLHGHNALASPEPGTAAQTTSGIWTKMWSTRVGTHPRASAGQHTCRFGRAGTARTVVEHNCSFRKEHCQAYDQKRHPAP